MGARSKSSLSLLSLTRHRRHSVREPIAVTGLNTCLNKYHNFELHSKLDRNESPKHSQAMLCLLSMAEMYMGKLRVSTFLLVYVNLQCERNKVRTK